MKRTILLFGIAALFASCAKEEKEPEDPPGGGGNGPAPGFTWTPAGSQAIVADEAYYVESFSNLVAIKNGGSKVVDINISDLGPGTYSISSALGNSLEYSIDNSAQKASSGQVTISARLNNKITGSFSASFSSGTLTGISGQFIDLQPK